MAPVPKLSIVPPWPSDACVSEPCIALSMVSAASARHVECAGAGDELVGARIGGDGGLAGSAGQRGRTGADELDLARPGAERHGGGIAGREHEGVSADRVAAGLREGLRQRPVISRLADRGRCAAGDR